MAAPRCPPRPPLPPRGTGRDTAPPSARELRAQHRQLQRDLARALTGDEGTLLELLQRRPEGRELLRLRERGRARSLLCARLWLQRRRLDALGPAHPVGLPRPAPPPRPPAAPQHRDRDREQALRGGLGRLRLRAEEAARLTALYRRLGAHLQDETGAARGRLEQLEAELERRRRELRDLRARGHRDRPDRGEQLRDRGEQQDRAEQLRDQGKRHWDRGERPERRQPRTPGPRHGGRRGGPGQDRPAPPQESLVQGQEGGGAPSVPPTPPPSAPPSPPPRLPEPPGSASPQRSVSPALAALARGQAVALGQLRAEVTALGEQLQRLRYGGERRREGSLCRAADGHERLREQRQRRDSAQRALAEVTRALGTATAGLGHLAGQLGHLGLGAGGAPAQPPPGDPQALLAQTRAGLAALQGGAPRALRPPPSAPQQQHSRPPPEEPPSHSSDEDAPPAGAPPSRAAIKRQSRLILEGRRGGRGGRGPPP